MRKRYRNPPQAPPGAVILDSQIVRREGEGWTAEQVLPSFRTVLCRRGKLHVCRDVRRETRTVCGEWIGIGSDPPAAGWTLAPGTWCGTGVVRCQHCENSLARTLGEKAARRTE
jgi:hypothetical protein